MKKIDKILAKHFGSIIYEQKLSSDDGFVVNIEKETINNSYFRKVIYTANDLQLVLMSIEPEDDIGEETHSHLDQFLRIEKGNGIAVLNGNEIPVTDGDSIIVPAGVKHNIINVSKDSPLKLYTLYSKPNHLDKAIQPTKEDEEFVQ